MAAPTMPVSEKQSPFQALFSTVGNAARALALPIGAVLFAFLAGAFVIVATGKDPLRAYTALLCGGFGIACNASVTPSLQVSETLVATTPLILTGIAVALSFRAGLFNIGAEGQLIVGAIAATTVGVKLGSLPGVLLLPLVLLAGALAGSVWGGIVGVLKATTGAHEVVTTIMLNYVAQNLLLFLIVGGPLQLPTFSSTSPSIAVGAQLPRLVPQNGTFLGQVGSVYRVHAGIFIALAAAIFFGYLLRRMALGYEIRAVGQSQRAARYAGISVRRTIIVTMLLSGAFAGLAGAVQIAGLRHNLTNTYQTDTLGFDAIAVALLGQNSAIGVVLAAILFGALHVGGQLMQSEAGISGNLADILQAFILFSVAANFLRTFRIRLPALGQRPPRAPETAPLAEADNAADEDALERVAADGGGTV
jgi:simple sugar transport system permease protein